MGASAKKIEAGGAFVRLFTEDSALRRGLKKNDLPAGTAIKVFGFQARDGTAKANGVNVTLPDGRALQIGSLGAGAPPEQK